MRETPAEVVAVPTQAEAVVPAPSVNPPPGWDVDSPLGLLAVRLEDGTQVKHARLAEVLKHIMSSEGLTMSEAAAIFIERMPDNIRDVLHWCMHGRGHRPIPVPPDHMFGFVTAEQKQRAKGKGERKERWQIYPEDAPYRYVHHADELAPVSEPGKQVLVDLIKCTWCAWSPYRRDGSHVLDSSDVPRLNLCTVPLYFAFQAWGYGVEEKPVEQEQRPSAQLLQLVPADPLAAKHAAYLQLVETYKVAKQGANFTWSDLPDAAKVIEGDIEWRAAQKPPKARSNRDIGRDFGVSGEVIRRLLAGETGVKRKVSAARRQAGRA